MMIDIKPIRFRSHQGVLSADELEAIQSATLHVLEQVGVCFPSRKALRIFAEHGAQVDVEGQIVHLPPDLVTEALSHAPRSFGLAGRASDADLFLDGTNSYFATDGTGTLTVDFETGGPRHSCKDDVAKMARVADHLSSIAFYWPMVSAQDQGLLAPLHEIDASFSNTVKHVQTVTVMGERMARYAIRMAEVVAGDRDSLRARPPLSSLVCTIAPLAQDEHGIANHRLHCPGDGRRGVDRGQR
jgi:trimethylamine:corrinoid methyltransferase-like protein